MHADQALDAIRTTALRRRASAEAGALLRLHAEPGAIARGQDDRFRARDVRAESDTGAPAIVTVAGTPGIR